MKKEMYRILAAAVLAIPVLLMTPASQAGASSCPAGFEEFAEYRLFFGRNHRNLEVVSDTAWREFLAAEITPRFPDGLTVLDAAGQWRGGAMARRVRGDFAGTNEAGDYPDQAGQGGNAKDGENCEGIQAYIRPGGRIAYGCGGLCVFLRR